MAKKTKRELFEEGAYKGMAAMVDFLDYHGRDAKEDVRLHRRAEVGAKAGRIYVADKSADNNARLIDLHARRLAVESGVDKALTAGKAA